MRICLAVHGFPPYERTGVENYTKSLAEALVRAGHAVSVFAPRLIPALPHLAMRREERNGYALTWIATNAPLENPGEVLDPPGLARQFGEFLEHERPEVVHFQHLVKLGTSLVLETHSRRIATVYTAHDYYALCHRYTLLLPDLSRCDVIGDSSACARCDLALGLLDRRAELGDYQMGVLPGQLDAAARAQLAAVLSAETARATVGPEEHDAAVARREELDRVRREAFRSIDLVVAPTRFLADRLIEGGLDAERIVHLPYGIDAAPLAAVAREHPIRPDPGTPLRIGYFGGISKHKGVHVLLEAFRGLRQPAELTIHGFGTDESYLRSIEALASEVGALFRGPYESEDLPALMAEVDLVVVPSLWVENYPIVIREAFAAKRPVVASRLGALSESVRDEVDGLLVEPGDAEALRALLERCVAEEGLLPRLVARIPPVHGIDDQARELVRLYEPLVDANEVRDRDLPESLVPHVRRYDELAALPTKELFLRAVLGTERLARGLLGDRESRLSEILSRSLAGGSRVQDMLRDRSREADWVRRTLAAEEGALRALGERLDWIEGIARDRDAAVLHLSSSLEDSVYARKTQEEELVWLRGLLESKEQSAAERDRDRDTSLAGLRDEVTWLRGVLAAKDQEIASLLGERDWRQGMAESRGAALDATLRAVGEARAALQLDSGSVIVDRIRDEWDGILRAVEVALGSRIEGGSDIDGGSEGDSPAVRSQRLLSELERLAEELGWRRAEMHWLVERTRRSRFGAFLAGRLLSPRIGAWRQRSSDGEGFP